MDEYLAKAQAQYGARLKNYYLGEDYIYSKQSINVATLFPTSFSFFTQGINTSGVNYSDTNLDQGSRLNNNDIFIVREVSFAVWKTVADADLNFLANGCHLDWEFYGNRFLVGTMECYPGGSMAYTSAVSNLGTLVTVSGLGPVISNLNGVPSIHNTFQIGAPGIELAGNDSFKCVLVNDAAPYTTATAAAGGTGITFTARLGGFRGRQIS
jgi:hypothetical protein